MSVARDNYTVAFAAVRVTYRRPGGRQPFARRPCSASATMAATRLARVSMCFADVSHHSRDRRADGEKVSHWTRAPGRAFSAAARSAGSMSASASSCITQDPSARAASITAKPASVMRPVAMRRSIRRLFESDQPLPRRRGVMRCACRPSGSEFTRPSIQPKQSASSTISSYATGWWPLALVQRATQTPSTVRWCSVNQWRHAPADVGWSSGRSRYCSLIARAPRYLRLRAGSGTGASSSEALIASFAWNAER